MAVTARDEKVFFPSGYYEEKEGSRFTLGRLPTIKVQPGACTLEIKNVVLVDV